MSKIYQFTGELTAEKIEELHAQVQRDKAKPTPPWGGNIPVSRLYVRSEDSLRSLLRDLALLKLRETGGVVPETPDSWGDMHAPYVDNRGYVYGNSHTTSGLVDEFVARECAVIVHEYKEACK